MSPTQSPRSYLITDTIDLPIQLERTHSFTEASMSLGISQSMASRKLSAFEDSLGCTVIDRSSRPVRLTPEGRRILKSLAPLVDTIPELLDSLRAENLIRRELRLGILDSFTRDICAKLIKTIDQQLKHCSVLSGTSDHLQSRFRSDELDIFVSSDPCFNFDNVRRKFLYSEPSLLVYPASMEFPEKNIEWSTLQFCGIPFIGLSNGSGGGKLFDNFILSHNIPICQKYKVDGVCVLLELVNEGMGWSIVRPAGLVQHKKFLNNIKVAPMPKPLLSREVYLISKKSFSYELYQSVYFSLAQLIRDILAPKTIALAPWLKDDLLIVDPATEKKKPFSEFIADQKDEIGCYKAIS